MVIIAQVFYPFYICHLAIFIFLMHFYTFSLNLCLFALSLSPLSPLCFLFEGDYGGFKGEGRVSSEREIVTLGPAACARGRGEFKGQLCKRERERERERDEKGHKSIVAMSIGKMY